ncbi:MAG: gamma carbonic anhydrase family protein [Deltaproteobacteria bacterium]|jgi:carbonic anhydrase/acetyltransferase-like protein (isoleucine patch superfamily)|nr:gamma carbonic anhydrase family protein [Deltaproteobacteria bacterium]
MPSLLPHKDVAPRLHPTVFVAAGARIIGDVEVGESSSVWFNAVIRGDILPIRIGRRTNIQDGCILHTKDGFPLTVGDEVTFGHAAIAHGCTIGELCLLGIGCIVLDGAVIGRGSVIGSGAVVPPGTAVPPHSLVMGVPGKVVKDLGPDSGERNRAFSDSYVRYALSYLGQGG